MAVSRKQTDAILQMSSLMKQSRLSRDIARSLSFYTWLITLPTGLSRSQKKISGRFLKVDATTKVSAMSMP